MIKAAAREQHRWCIRRIRGFWDYHRCWGELRRPDAHRKYRGGFAGESRLVAPVTKTGRGGLDRSPCGTGTCAKMAALHAKGESSRWVRISSSQGIMTPISTTAADRNQHRRLPGGDTHAYGQAWIRLRAVCAGPEDLSWKVYSRRFPLLKPGDYVVSASTAGLSRTICGVCHGRTGAGDEHHHEIRRGPPRLWKSPQSPPCRLRMLT